MRAGFQAGGRDVCLALVGAVPVLLAFRWRKRAALGTCYGGLLGVLQPFSQPRFRGLRPHIERSSGGCNEENKEERQTYQK